MRDQNKSLPVKSGHDPIWFVYVLVLANVVAWYAGGVWPAGVGAPWWHAVAYGFSHGPWWHLAVNMLALFSLGIGVERAYGARQFAGAYLVCLVAGSVVQAALAPTQPVIGASGAVFGLLTLYGGLYSDRKVYLIVLPLLARHAVAAYVGLELIFAITGILPGIAHWCHLGGFAGAVAAYPFLKRKDIRNDADRRY